MLAACLACCVCAAPVSAIAAIASGAQEGVVVDATSGQPIAGAYVVGRWAGTYATNIAHSTGESCVHQAVVQTDSSGHFHMPAWRRDETRLDEMYFVIALYKRGYTQVPMPGEAKDSGTLNRLLRSGNVAMDEGRFHLKMKPLADNQRARAEELLHFMRTAGCPYRHPWGELYPVYSAILEEVSALSPEAQQAKVGPGDVIGRVKRMTEDARLDLGREAPAGKEPQK